MYRPEFVRRITKSLKDSDKRKNISIPKQVLKITDEDGNSRDFSVKRKDKSVIYTAEDVNAIMDAALEVIEDALTHGEEVNLKGFGAICLKYRKARRTKVPMTDDWVEVRGRYIARISPGQRLRTCAKIYEQLVSEKLNGVIDAVYDDSDTDDAEDGEE